MNPMDAAQDSVERGADCLHHWQIEQLPRNEVYSGQCSRCGDRRTWPQQVDYATKTRASQQARREALSRAAQEVKVKVK